MRKQDAKQRRYAIYLRCSSDDQKHGDFTTIDAQRDINTRTVAAQGGTFVGEYADEGKSGTNLNRPEWKRLLADAQEGRFDAVYVTYMSRLGRGDAFVIAEHELSKHSIRVEMVQENFTDDLNGYLSKKMTNMMDGIYPKMVSQWTKTKQQEMVARGYRTGGIVPFGYSTEVVRDAAGFHKADREPPRRLVPDPEYAPFVKGAFTLFVEQGNYGSVVRYLNGVSSRQWSLKAVIDLLHNEVYKGVQKFGQWRNETAHPPIVSAELWEAVQKKDLARARTPKPDPVDKSSFYLRSLIHCGHCSGRMTPANHHGRVARVRYYECLCGGKRAVACPVKRVNAGSVHDAVLTQIRRAAEHPTCMNEIIREAVKLMPTADKSQGLIAGIARRSRETEKKIKNITSAIESGGGAVRSLLARLEELEEERTRLAAEQGQLELKITESQLQRPDAALVQGYWKQFLTIWEVASEEERGRLMPLVVERVELTEKERGFCRLVFQPQIPRSGSFSTSGNVVVSSQMGAANSCGANNYSGIAFDSQLLRAPRI